MIEDEDNKVRRNLVTFSAAVLLIAWLEIPFAALSHKLIASGWTVSASRAWGAALLVLAYLALRYRFIGDGHAVFGKMSELCGTQRTEQVNAYVHGQLAIFQRQKKDSSIFEPRLSQLYQQAAEELVAKFDSNAGPLVCAFATENYGQRVFSDMSGAATIVFYWDDPKRMKSPIGETSFLKKGSLTYRVPFLRQLGFQFEAWRTSWMYSREALEWMAPIALCVVAIAVISFKLTSIILA